MGLVESDTKKKAGKKLLTRARASRSRALLSSLGASWGAEQVYMFKNVSKVKKNGKGDLPSRLGSRCVGQSCCQPVIDRREGFCTVNKS